MTIKQWLKDWVFRRFYREHYAYLAKRQDALDAKELFIADKERLQRERANELEQASMELTGVAETTKVQQLVAGQQHAMVELSIAQSEIARLREDKALIAKALNLGPDEPLEGYLMAMKRANDAAEELQAAQHNINEANGLRQMKQLMATYLDDAQLMAYRSALQKAMGAQIYDEDLEREWQRRAMPTSFADGPRRRDLSNLLEEPS